MVEAIQQNVCQDGLKKIQLSEWSPNMLTIGHKRSPNLVDLGWPIHARWSKVMWSKTVLQILRKYRNF